MMTDHQSIHLMRQALAAFRQEQISTAAFCQTWRAQSALLAALPVRFAEVMEDILARMEAGSLFTEESCSFSQEDLAANLRSWLDKAQQAIYTRQES